MSEYTSVEIKNGELKMKVLSLGGIITNLYTPDKNGKSGDIVLWNNSTQDYFKNCAYMGAIIGRTASRIADAKATLNGESIKLTKNEKSFSNCLHGGAKGFDKQNWSIEKISGHSFKGVSLNYLAKDGQEGFPGNLNVTVNYKLTDERQLVIEYTAFTDAPTLCSLTNHSYFNLSAGKSPTILEHEMQVSADFYTPLDKKFRPTGEILSVKNTPLDFSKPKVLGPAILENGEFFEISNGGLDHNYVLPNANGALVKAASLRDPISGRIMDVYTDQPGLQVYTSNFLDGSISGKFGKPYNKYAAICFETQKLPDAANFGHFPTIELYADQIYSATTGYAF